MQFMDMKITYSSPQARVLEMDYADPVCQATSGNVPDYGVDPYDPVWV